MYPSSTLCRAQEAYQRKRAAGTPLDNVRIVANKAADAWGQEALGAERREARHERTRAIADALSTQKRHAREEAQNLFSQLTEPNRTPESLDAGPQ